MRDLKKTDGRKKAKLSGYPKLDDAHQAGKKNSLKCKLLLTEVDSAKAFATNGYGVDGFTREYHGIFPLKGKILNVKSATLAQLANNEELNALKQIIGLRQNAVYTNAEDMKDLRYGGFKMALNLDCPAVGCIFFNAPFPKKG